MEAHPCIQCQVNVTGRSHAIACDGCDRWNHRKCGTGITHQQYLQIGQGNLTINWRCQACEEAVQPAEPMEEIVEPDEPMEEIVEPDEPERSRHNSTTLEDQIPPPMDVDVSPMRPERRGDDIPDVTFDLTGREFQGPTAPLEESLEDRPLNGDDIPDDEPLTFEVVESGTKRGATKLLASDGYTYTRGVKSGNRQFWRCAVRNKTTKCPASVKEFMGTFTRGINGHVHPADPGAAVKVKVAKRVKEVAQERVFEPAAAIVERVMKDIVTPNDDNLSRAANRMRCQRPEDPVDLDFELDRAFVGEDFIVDDIRMDGARHIIFGTRQQLELLRLAKRWFLDGTFKVVKDPFYQLHTIHVFIKKGDDEKQVPLAYVLMSRRSKEDYIQVLTSLRNHLGQLHVEWFMLDFEAATWQAIREVFPQAIIKGCVFHLTQRIYRKIQNEGLHTAYIQRGDKFQYLRKLMSLPYLPVEQIVPAFDRLKTVAEEAGGKILEVVDYVERIWVRGRVWQPANWCVFREVVRTNNDLEGWHRRLNARAGNPNLGVYKLSTILRGEAETVDLQIRLVSDNLLTKIRRKKYRQLHGRLEDAWDQYEEDEMTTTSLLRTVSSITGLRPTTAARNIYPDDE